MDEAKIGLAVVSNVLWDAVRWWRLSLCVYRRRGGAFPVRCNAAFFAFAPRAYCSVRLDKYKPVLGQMLTRTNARTHARARTHACMAGSGVPS